MSTFVLKNSRIVLLNSSIPKPSGNIGHNSAPSIKVARVPVYSEKLFSQDLEFILMIIDRFRVQESGAFNYCILIRVFLPSSFVQAMTCRRIVTAYIARAEPEMFPNWHE